MDFLTDPRRREVASTYDLDELLKTPPIWEQMLRERCANEGLDFDEEMAKAQANTLLRAAVERMG